MNTLKTAVLGSIILCSLSSFAHSQTPQQQSCALIKAMLTDSPKTQLGGIATLITHWDRQAGQSFLQKAAAALNGQKYISGNVFLVGQLGNDLTDHMITIKSKNGGVNYLRVHYEWTKGQPLAQYLAFEEHYSVIVKLPFPQAPKKVGC